MSSTDVESEGTSSHVPVSPVFRFLRNLLGSSTGRVDSFSLRMVGFSTWAGLAATMAGMWVRTGTASWDALNILMCIFSSLALVSLLAPNTSVFFLQLMLSSIRDWYRIGAVLVNLTSTAIVWYKIRVGVGDVNSILKVCSQQAYNLSDSGAVVENPIVVEAEVLDVSPARVLPWLWVSFASEPVLEGIWSVAGPVCRTGEDGERGTVFVTQTVPGRGAGADLFDEEFDSRFGTLYSERFRPGLLICRSGWLWCSKPRSGSGQYVNRPREVDLTDIGSGATQGSGQVSRKLVVWGSTATSYWDYLAVLGVVNTLSLLVVVLAGGQGTEVTVVFSINLITELLAVFLCVGEVVVGRHGSLRLGSALDPVNALRFLSSSGVTVAWVLFLEVGSAVGGMIYLAIQREWLLAVVGTAISVIGCVVSMALLPTRARWLSAALVLYCAEFVVEGALASRSRDPLLFVVLVSSIFETLELVAFIARIGFGAFKLDRSKSLGELDVALECGPIATGESCNWGLGLALGRGMIRSKSVAAGKRWPKELRVTRGTGEDAVMGKNDRDPAVPRSPDLELCGGNVEFYCQRLALLDGWGCIAFDRGRSTVLRPTCAFEDDDFEASGSERFFGLKSYGGEVFPVL